MLVFSRPKGTYNASKADHVLVDWYLVNGELGDKKMSIKATVQGPALEESGRQLVIKEWKPYVLENLRSGEYTISMELDDKDGKAVPGASNSVTRKFVVNREAPEERGGPPGAEGEKKGEHHKGDVDKDKKGEHHKGDVDKDKKGEDKPKAEKPKAEDKPKADKK